MLIMPISYTSSVVFAGGQFAASMFDEREFCTGFGPLEADQIKAGPIGRFQYFRGRYQFNVVPDRVELQCNDPLILSEALITAAGRVIERLEPVRSVVSVSGIGLNCDAVFSAREIGRSGSVWCRSLMDTPRTQRLFEQEVESFAQFSFQIEGVRYVVRLEPHAQSQGENLFVAVNGHQDLAAAGPMEEKLQAVG